MEYNTYFFCRAHTIKFMRLGVIIILSQFSTILNLVVVCLQKQQKPIQNRKLKHLESRSSLYSKECNEILKSKLNFVGNTSDNNSMQQNKKISDQLRVIYHAIGLLPKVNGTYLSHKRDSQLQNLQKDSNEFKKYQRQLDIQQAKRRLSHQIKKRTLIEDKEKKGVSIGAKNERSVTEVSKGLSDQLNLEAQERQQKLHIVKLSEFLRLRTRQIVVYSNYKKCINKMRNRRQRNVSNRTVDSKKQRYINYFLPDTKPMVNKLDSIKIKINKCDVKKLDILNSEISERKKSVQQISKKYSFKEILRNKNNIKNEGILAQGEKLQNQVHNQTKLNRWQINESKFRTVKKQYGRVEESWELDHDEIYL